MQLCLALGMELAGGCGNGGGRGVELVLGIYMCMCVSMCMYTPTYLLHKHDHLRALDTDSNLVSRELDNAVPGAKKICRASSRDGIHAAHEQRVPSLRAHTGIRRKAGGRQGGVGARRDEKGTLSSRARGSAHRCQDHHVVVCLELLEADARRARVPGLGR